MKDRQLIVSMKELGAEGGKARAKKLSREQLTESARKAAKARWSRSTDTPSVDVPVAGWEAELPFGEIMIPCGVIEQHIPGEGMVATRVLSERGFTKGLGGKRGGSHWQRLKEGGAKLPVFLSANNLKPFIDEELSAALSNPIKYRSRAFGGVAHGIEATLIPDILEVFLKARDANALKGKQVNLATKAELLMRGFARVGIVALVDEATGYEQYKAKNDLVKVLEKFISKDLVKWVPTFPESFYRELYRLYGWRYSTEHTRRPIVVGKLTIDLVYQRLPPGVLTELQSLTPRNDKGKLKHKLFQHLSQEVGHPALKEHFVKLDTLFQAARGDKEEFRVLADRVIPRQKDPRDMPLFKQLIEAEDALLAEGRVIDSTAIAIE